MKSKLSKSSEKVRGHREGFTLVEMLLVLVILSTLAAIVYPMFMKRGEMARITAAQTQIGVFKTVLNAYEMDNGFFPKTLTELVQQPSDAANWHGPYLESIPNDPWGHSYIYYCPGKHNSTFYDISSEGKPGASAPIGNWVVKQSSTTGFVGAISPGTW